MVWSNDFLGLGGDKDDGNKEDKVRKSSVGWLGYKNAPTRIPPGITYVNGAPPTNETPPNNDPTQNAAAVASTPSPARAALAAEALATLGSQPLQAVVTTTVNEKAMEPDGEIASKKSNEEEEVNEEQEKNEKEEEEKKEEKEEDKKKEVEDHNDEVVAKKIPEGEEDDDDEVMAIVDEEEVNGGKGDVEEHEEKGEEKGGKPKRKAKKRAVGSPSTSGVKQVKDAVVRIQHSIAADRVKNVQHMTSYLTQKQGENNPGNASPDYL